MYFKTLKMSEKQISLIYIIFTLNIIHFKFINVIYSKFVNIIKQTQYYFIDIIFT